MIIFYPDKTMIAQTVTYYNAGHLRTYVHFMTPKLEAEIEPLMHRHKWDAVE